MATLMQMSPWVATPGGTPSFTHYSPTTPANHAKDTGGSEHVHCTPRVGPGRLSDKLLLLQEKRNIALELLLTNRATGDFCHKETGLKCGTGSSPEQCLGH